MQMTLFIQDIEIPIPILLSVPKIIGEVVFYVNR